MVDYKPQYNEHLYVGQISDEAGCEKYPSINAEPGRASEYFIDSNSFCADDVRSLHLDSNNKDGFGKERQGMNDKNQEDEDRCVIGLFGDTEPSIIG